MHIIKYALFVAALSLPVTNTHALEWVDYDGTIPDNAVGLLKMNSFDGEDRIVCRWNGYIGLIINDECYSFGAVGNDDKQHIHDGFQIMINTLRGVDGTGEVELSPDVDPSISGRGGPIGRLKAERAALQAEYDAVAEYEHHDEEQLVVSHELQDEEIKVGYDASPLQAEYDAVVDENVALKAYLDYIVAEYSKVLEEFDVELARHAIIQECLDTVLEGKERTSLLFELCHSAPGLHLDQHEVGKEWSELAD